MLTMRTWLLIGGGVAALAGGAYVLSSQRVSSAPAPELTSLPSYYPPMVSGGFGGSGGGIDPGGLNASGAYSTDNSIASIIASNLSIAQLESTTTLETTRIEKDVALAGYATDLALNKDDNRTSLGLQRLLNAGQSVMASIMGTNDRELAKVTGSNEQMLASITGSNASSLANITGNNALQLATQSGNAAISLKGLDMIGKGGGKVKLPNDGGVIKIKPWKKKKK